MAANFIVSQVGDLPADLEPLVQASVSEGFRFLQRLRSEWSCGVNRFEKPEEAFFVARRGSSLAGVCGLNSDPYSADESVGRLRHLYVAERWRRQGIARALVRTAVSSAWQAFSVVRVRTDTLEGNLFYRALGFSPVVSSENATHELQLQKRPAA